jgi:hypothetical protein
MYRTLERTGRNEPGYDFATFVEAQQELDRFSGVALNASVTYAGKITDKWINKVPEGSHLAMPANVKADGNTFEVGVSYRNDSTMTITGGVEVVVTKPSGQVVTPAIDWAGMGPGASLNKEYNIAAVDQTGTWSVTIRFLALT